MDEASKCTQTLQEAFPSLIKLQKLKNIQQNFIENIYENLAQKKTEFDQLKTRNKNQLKMAKQVMNKTDERIENLMQKLETKIKQKTNQNQKTQLKIKNKSKSFVGIKRSNNPIIIQKNDQFYVCCSRLCETEQFIFLTQQGYQQHLWTEHNIIPYLWESIEKDLVFSHFYLSGKLIANKLFIFEDFRKLYIIINLIKQCFFVCGKCIQNKTKGFYFCPDTFAKHIMTVHNGQNQQGSTHFMIVSEKKVRIQPFLKLEDNYFEQKIFISHLKRYKINIHQVIQRRKLFSKKKSIWLNNNISQLQTIARMPPKLRKRLQKDYFYTKNQCQLCKTMFDSSQSLLEHLEKKHSIKMSELQQKIDKNSNINCSSKKLAMIFASKMKLLLRNQLIWPYYCKKKIGNRFSFYSHIKKCKVCLNQFQRGQSKQQNKKNQANLGQNVQDILTNQIYKCGHCNQEQAYFTDKAKFVKHISCNHEVFSKYNTHHILGE